MNSLAFYIIYNFFFIYILYIIPNTFTMIKLIIRWP